jgi:toxin CcdB
MAQFTVHRNNNPKSKTGIPYLLDVQSNLLAELNTRVVVPLYLRKSLHTKPITRLMPEFTIENKKTVLMTPQLAGVSIKNIGEPVADFSAHRDEIIAALDLLVTGV